MSRFSLFFGFRAQMKLSPTSNITRWMLSEPVYFSIFRMLNIFFNLNYLRSTFVYFRWWLRRWRVMRRTSCMEVCWETFPSIHHQSRLLSSIVKRLPSLFLYSIYKLMVYCQRIFFKFLGTILKFGSYLLLFHHHVVW